MSQTRHRTRALPQNNSMSKLGTWVCSTNVLVSPRWSTLRERRRSICYVLPACTAFCTWRTPRSPTTTTTVLWYSCQRFVHNTDLLFSLCSPMRTSSPLSLTRTLSQVALRQAKRDETHLHSLLFVPNAAQHCFTLVVVGGNAHHPPPHPPSSPLIANI